MRINLCKIDAQNGERLTISYDTKDHNLYSSDAPSVPLDTPELHSAGDAVDYCRASWENDGAGVWGFEWTIQDFIDEIRK